MAKENEPKTKNQVNESSRKRLSLELWIAIGIIAAMVIIGGVTVLKSNLPKSAPPVAQSSTSSPSPKPAQSPPRVFVNADEIAGKWAGPGRDTNGRAFQITLEVRKNCAFGERCGLMSVSPVPCYGEVFLQGAKGYEFEFRVANLSGQSDRERCHLGAGEAFTLRPDGKLYYSTLYEPKAKAIMVKTGS